MLLSGDCRLVVKLSREYGIGNLTRTLTVKRAHGNPVTRRADLAGEPKILVIRGMLEGMRLRPDAVDLERHFRMTCKPQEPSALNLDWARGWLRDLLAANRESRRLHEREISVVAARVWLQLCWCLRRGKPLRLLAALSSMPRAQSYPRGGRVGALFAPDPPLPVTGR